VKVGLLSQVHVNSCS